MHPADVDGDGDLDVLYAEQTNNTIAWSENMDGAGTFGPQQAIDSTAASAMCVRAGDLDGDGDLDVLGASFDDDTIAWHENTDGAGTFGRQIVTRSSDFANSTFAADLDGDGDLDVVTASPGDDKIAWFENTDGAGTFRARQVITTSADGALSVHAADLDGDGDADVLSASAEDDTVAWYENMDGAGSFGVRQVISNTAHWATSVYVADLDNDGDLDVLSASMDDSKIAWYENTDAAGTFGSEQIITTNAVNARCVYAADLDGDGDHDVLSASWFGLAWYENTDGAGTFGQLQYITTPNVLFLMESVCAADLDGDGDQDVDAGAGDVTVSLESGQGILVLANSVGLTEAVGDGTVSVRLTETLASVNAALQGLRFVPHPDCSGTVTLSVTADDLGNTGSGGARRDSDAIVLMVNQASQPPRITSADTVEVPERTTSAVAVTASDPDEDTLSFHIAGGADQGAFSIDAISGALRFVKAPDFENPGDANGDNVYEVQVVASDGQHDTPLN